MKGGIPKTGNRAATGSSSAVLWRSAKNILEIACVSEISGMNKFCNEDRSIVTPYVKSGGNARKLPFLELHQTQNSIVHKWHHCQKYKDKLAVHASLLWFSAGSLFLARELLLKMRWGHSTRFRCYRTPDIKTENQRKRKDEQQQVC